MMIIKRHRTRWAVALFSLCRQFSWSFIPVPSRKSWLGQAIVNSGLSWSWQVEHFDDSCLSSSDSSRDPSHDHDAPSVSTRILQSPREWLEYFELQDGQEGAYTVMRCDFYPSTNQWIRWGEIFHQERLIASLQRLLQETSPPVDFVATINATHQVVESLLSAASQSIEVPMTLLPDNAATVMVTLLWTPRVGQRIKVRGHAFHTGQISSPRAYEPVPMVVNLATRTRAFPASHTSGSDTLPNRYQHNPQAKLSSWCRRRVPLEEEFKLSGIGEVILTRQNGTNVELLEGLTSNLFVVYRDGSLHTPSEDRILGGLARQLVLDHAKQSGLQIAIGSVDLSTASEWSEVFVTSAVKVITPVAKIVVMRRLEDGSLTTDTVWTRHDGLRSEVWREILSQILQSYT